MLIEERNLNLERRYIEITDLITTTCEDPEIARVLNQEAKIKLLKMIGIIKIFIKEATPGCLLRLNGMLAVAHFMLADVCFAYMRDQLSSIRYLRKSLAITENYGEESYVMLLRQIILNRLAMILVYQDPHEALFFLDKAENVFMKCRNLTPVEMADMFLISIEPLSKTDRNLFERNYEDTMYMKARIYFIWNDLLKAATFAHKALSIQLEFEYFNHLAWIKNAILTCSIFLNKFRFKQARHYLSAAHCVFDSLIINYKHDKDAGYRLFCTRSELLLTWAAYGIELLSFSKVIMLSRSVYKGTMELVRLQSGHSTSATKEEIQNLIFTGLELEQYENQITDQMVVTPQEARRVFKSINNWLDEVLLFCSDPHSDIYLRILRNRSKTYFLLALFEQNSRIKSNLHQKRIDSLEKLRAAMDYVSVVEQRQLFWQELARSYCDFVYVELDTYHAEPAIGSANTINSYLQKSIESYLNYLNCYRNPDTNEYPERIVNVSNEIDFLYTHVTVALLYDKFINPTHEENLKHGEEQKNMLQIVVDYCIAHPDAQEHLKYDFTKYAIIEMYRNMRERH